MDLLQKQSNKFIVYCRMKNRNYEEKFLKSIPNTSFKRLSEENQTTVKALCFNYEFSFQEIRQLIEWSIDFDMWNEKPLSQIIQEQYRTRKEAFGHIREVWSELKNKPHNYTSFDKNSYADKRKISFQTKESETLSLGSCPVASPNTRCCNLMTLDSVESCGFDCSYCSIQSFYNQNKVTFDLNFTQKLKQLKLDPNKTYHIGTGQSSDSLMWGNKEGILDALFDFARRHPNVILEFKTKSNNIGYFLENDVPDNIVCTWSLNTPTIIEHEEHLTATLQQRLDAASKVAQQGVVIGFHFHPIVQYENYLSEYKIVFDQLIERFDPNQVALVSFGTLTFIKPVIQKLRSRNLKSKILQMPFENANGKQSYPLSIKKEMFQYAYKALAPWHEKVFFYLCMEDHTLWKDVFGYEYASNEEMETAMKTSYFSTIEANKNKVHL